jgi:hypothetical protein
MTIRTSPRARQIGVRLLPVAALLGLVGLAAACSSPQTTTRTTTSEQTSTQAMTPAVAPTTSVTTTKTEQTTP